MRLKALNAIKHDGELYCVGDVFEIDKKGGGRLVSLGAGYETSESVTGKDVKVDKSALDGEALYENTEDFHKLKVDELRAVCGFLEISASGHKSDLVAAILAEKDVIGGIIKLDEMDKEALIVLAEEEGVDLPADADEEQMRDILADALMKGDE